MNICEFLQHRNVPYQDVDHAETMTASRLAEALHVPGDQVAKTVLLRANGGYVIAVVPSTRYVDCEKVSGLLGTMRVMLATEADAAMLFPDVELGVVPPFGSQYGLRTIVDVHLAACETIVFEGPTHHQAIKMSYSDYQMLESPLEAMIATPKMPFD